MTSPHHHNRRAWDDRARNRKRFTRLASADALHDPLATVDAVGWLRGGVHGKRLLALAAGGGKHAAIYAAAGARVTVVDISAEMLALDRKAAAELGHVIDIVQASMDDLSALGDAVFDIVIHPVSTCYVPDLEPVYREVARVTRPGGVYISQHKQPASMQADIDPTPRGYEIVEPYYRTGPLPGVAGSPHREEGTLEYLHRWDQLLGAMCRTGFLIEDLIEPRHGKPPGSVPGNAAKTGKSRPGTFEHRSWFVPPYVRVKARRVQREPDGGRRVEILPP